MAADSPFYMRFGNFTSGDYSGNIFVINRAQTIGNGWLDASSNYPEYRVLGHSIMDGNGMLLAKKSGIVSAGCFMNDVETLNRTQNQITTWGIDYPYDVRST
ncbi:hypothetical protein [Sediminispirochaeta bajacaliforniensis]|uniref:hypothetical protein n=1 Tax=Sediminispirochaeta bajacaliforniensis TaxID=148 RepID=UPI000370F16A|nr:hypothetical protein [Sediminispirochaeta bajacaliforniensis]